MTETKPKHAGGRPRTGTLELRGGTWHARLTVTSAAGVTTRPWVDLGLKSKHAAKARMARVQAEYAAQGQKPADLAKMASRQETVAELAAAYIERRKVSIKTWKDEARWLKIDVLPAIGTLSIDQVRDSHIREVLDDVRARGRGNESIKHIRYILLRMFERPRRDKIIPENPVADVKVDEFRVRENKRDREILTDDEFVRFVSCEAVDLELRVMAVAAQTIGGMRTGDVHAWTWQSIDLIDFARCDIPRAKTGTPQELVLPPVGRMVMRAWWFVSGKPQAGPVFPVRRGKRAGEQKAKGSHADRLRKGLLVAGVDRYKVHNDTPTSRRVDFHSFRRALSTALSDAGVPLQRASNLVGHTTLGSHVKYLMKSTAMKTIPDAAVPQLLSFATGKDKTRKGQIWNTSEVQPISMLETAAGPPVFAGLLKPDSLPRFNPADNAR